MRATIGSFAFLLLAGCNQLFVEADVPSLCQHLGAQRFTVPAEWRSQVAQLSQDFDFNVAVQLPAELQDAERTLTLSSVRLTATGSPADLGFAESAQLTLFPPAGSALAPGAISYQRQEPRPTVVNWSGHGLELGQYLQTGAVKYSVSLLGTLPEQDVVVDIDVCASASLKLNYLK